MARDRQRVDAQVEGRAPHLLPGLLVHVAEKLGEPGEQVHLRHREVDREARSQPGIEFGQPHAHVGRKLLPFGLRPEEQVCDADGDDCAAHRLPGPVLAHQPEEAVPGSAPREHIALLASLVGHVPAGDIEEHRRVGEPPFAVARAPNARHLRFAAVGLLGKPEAQVVQHGRIARARGADHDIPGQFVQRSPALLESGYRGFEPLTQGVDTFRGRIVRGHLRTEVYHAPEKFRAFRPAV